MRTKTFTREDELISRFQSLNSEHDIVANDIGLFILAFVHRSIVNERPDKAPEHNERLEFLGDAVLELVITEQLFQDFPEKPEGELTDIRSSIVRGKNLALISSRLGFSKYLFLGKGEEQSGGRENPYLLANVVEAYIGAMYIDQGYLVTKQFILKHVYSSLDSILQSQNIKDFKTIFQEWSQSEYDLTPVYKVLEHSGPDHDKVFITGVFVGEKQMGEGKGSSKKKSQESAAESAYLQLKS